MSGEQPTGRPSGRRSGAVPRIGRAPGPDHPARREEIDPAPTPAAPSLPAPTPTPDPLARRGRRDEDPLVPFGSRLRRSTHRRLRIYATIHEQDIQDITNEALVEWLDRHDQEGQGT